LYLWTAAFISHLMISYHDFFFFLPLLARWLLLYFLLQLYSCVR
jgi:hypothetical protein